MAKILVVDDDDDTLQILVLLLRRTHSNHSIEGAASGEEALQKLTQFSPDLIITDQRMPGMDGLELIVQIHLICPGLPHIFTTGDNPDDIGRSPKYHGGEIILKPYDFEVVESAIENALSSVGVT